MKELELRQQQKTGSLQRRETTASAASPSSQRRNATLRVHVSFLRVSLCYLGEEELIRLKLYDSEVQQRTLSTERAS
ncbi:hypothetical protein JOB18_005935 [Solea senegalensis]|uniref:Uncharacterized protein n=1 Tax=Solea senegalensis TaxID=28829 RepID=A0AAV6R4D9_SOLSE|nr:hypothetical protein JOB18_005935 [Solea senegalensis]